MDFILDLIKVVLAATLLQIFIIAILFLERLILKKPMLGKILAPRPGEDETKSKWKSWALFGLLIVICGSFFYFGCNNLCKSDLTSWSENIPTYTDPHPDEKLTGWMGGFRFDVHVRFPECWHQDTRNRVWVTDVLFEDPLELESTESCPREYQGEWKMYFSPSRDVDRGKDWWKPHVPNGHMERIRINGNIVFFFDQTTVVTDRNSKKMNLEPKIEWLAIMECQHTFEAHYYEPVDKAKGDEMAKIHVVPDVFKKFLSGVDCKI